MPCLFSHNIVFSRGLASTDEINHEVRPVEIHYKSPDREINSPQTQKSKKGKKGNNNRSKKLKLKQIASVFEEEKNATNFTVSEDGGGDDDVMRPGECKAKTEIVFHKTHKCSSSSIQNFLMRYAKKHELNLVLPKVRLTGSSGLNSQSKN